MAAQRVGIDVGDMYTGDGESQDYSAGYTDEYATEEYYSEEPAPEPQPIAARDETSAAREAREATAAQRAAEQRMAEERRVEHAAKVAEARAYLDAEGYATQTMGEAEVTALAAKLRAEKAAVDEQRRRIEALGTTADALAKDHAEVAELIATVRLEASMGSDGSAEIRLVSEDDYVRLTAEPGFIGKAQRVVVDASDDLLKAFIAHAVRTTRDPAAPGFIERVALFAAVAVEDVLDDAVPPVPTEAEADGDAAAASNAPSENEVDLALFKAAWRAFVRDEELPRPSLGAAMGEASASRAASRVHSFGRLKNPHYADVDWATEGLVEAVSNAEAATARVHELEAVQGGNAFEAAKRRRALAQARAAEQFANRHVATWESRVAVATREQQEWQRAKTAQQAREAAIQRKREERADAMARRAVPKSVRRQMLRQDANEKKRNQPQKETEDMAIRRLRAKCTDAAEGEYDVFNFSSPLITAIPAAIANVKTLTELSLTGCSLETLPSLGEMRLRKINLSNNKFAQVPGALLSTVGAELRLFDMSHNKLKALPPAMAELRSLEIIRVEYNQLEELCDVSKMPNLEVLEATDNNLRSIPSGLGTREKLWRLRLGANPLIDVPPEVYQQGINAIKAYLSEQSPQNLPVPPSNMHAELNAALSNPTACDCVVIAMREDGAKHQITTLTVLLEARAPELAKTVAVADASADETARVCEVALAEPCSEAALNAFGALLSCDLSTEMFETLRAEDATAVTALVSASGGATLARQLVAVQERRLFDPSSVLARDFGALKRWVPGTDFEARHLGRTVRFAVGKEGAIFVVDRELICARVEYFAGMLGSGLAEATMDLVPLRGVEPEIFEAFLEYVYADNTSKLSPDHVVALLFLAAEYNCPRLRAMAECVVGVNVDVGNVAQVLQLAHFIDSERLKSACLHFAARNVAAVVHTPAFKALQQEIRDEFREKVAALHGRAAGF